MRAARPRAVRQRPAPARRGPRTWMRIAAAAAAGLATIATLAVVVSSHGRVARHHQHGAPSTPLPVFSQDKPLAGAARNTLAAAELAVGFVIPVPHVGLAEEQDLSTVWLERASHEVALVFSQGLVSMEVRRATYRGSSSGGSRRWSAAELPQARRTGCAASPPASTWPATCWRGRCRAVRCQLPPSRRTPSPGAAMPSTGRGAEPQGCPRPGGGGQRRNGGRSPRSVGILPRAPASSSRVGISRTAVPRAPPSALCPWRFPG